MIYNTIDGSYCMHINFDLDKMFNFLKSLLRIKLTIFILYVKTHWINDVEKLVNSIKSKCKKISI